MEAFVERTYRIAIGDGKSRKVHLVLYKPTQEVDGDWTCEHKIDGLDVDEPLAPPAFGVDGIQALLLSFQMAEARLKAHARSLNGELIWPSGSGGVA